MRQGHRGVRRRSCGADGFSLLEMLVAMALVALVVVLLQPLMRGASRDRLLDVAARELASRLRTARLDAIRTNAETSLIIDLVGRGYEAAGPGQRWLLPAGLEIDATVGTSDAVGSATVKIRFYPDGSSSGGNVRLRDGKRDYRLVVEWLSGHVRTAPGGGR